MAKLTDQNKEFLELLNNINNENISMKDKKNFIINHLPEYKIIEYTKNINEINNDIDKFQEKKGNLEYNKNQKKQLKQKYNITDKNLPINFNKLKQTIFEKIDNKLINNILQTTTDEIKN